MSVSTLGWSISCRPHGQRATRHSQRKHHSLAIPRNYRQRAQQMVLLCFQRMASYLLKFLVMCDSWWKVVPPPSFLLILSVPVPRVPPGTKVTPTPSLVKQHQQTQETTAPLRPGWFQCCNSTLLNTCVSWQHPTSPRLLDINYTNTSSGWDHLVTCLTTTWVVYSLQRALLLA